MTERRSRKEKKARAKQLYRKIRKPIAPPTGIEESKLRPRRQKKVDLKQIDWEEVEEELR